MQMEASSPGDCPTEGDIGGSAWILYTEFLPFLVETDTPHPPPLHSRVEIRRRLKETSSLLLSTSRMWVLGFNLKFSGL